MPVLRVLLLLLSLLSIACGQTGSGGGNPTTDISISAQNYEINSTLVNDYECWSQRVSLSSEKHITGFEATVDNSTLVHHIVIFKDMSRDAPEGNFQCITDMESDWIFIYGWAPGMQDFVLPPEAGLPIQDGDQIILQVHYFNPSAAEGTDDSRVRLLSTGDLRTNDAGVIALGNVAFDLDPGKSEVTVEGRCDTGNPFPFLPVPQPLTEPVTAFGSMLHMHRLGSQIWTDVIRDGEAIGGTGSGALGKNLNWNFDLQVLQPLEFVIQPGDVLKTTCVYDTTNQTDVVSFGLGTADEMCFNFVYYYPAIDLPFFPFCGEG